MFNLKTINRYIPELVYNKLQQLDFNNKEQLYIICDMIYRISIYRKENTDYSNIFRDIPSIYFTNIIADKNNYKKAMDFLKDNNILECDNVYSKMGGKALGYKFSDEYISKLITVKISKPTIFKRIIKNINENKNNVNDKYKTYKDFFLNNFKIDYNNALLYLNNWWKDELENLNYIHNTNSPLCSSFLEDYIKLDIKYNHLFMSISSINDGELFFRHNKTNGRIDTNLTNLKSELKQFISIDNLYQIDIKNSQPFFLYLSLPNPPLCSSFLDKEELDKYCKWVKNGVFYENFQLEYLNKTGINIERKKIKDLMFCIFFSKNSSYIKEKKIFKCVFPTILEYISKEKNIKHNQLAIKMQKIESEMCIDIICDELNKENIKYLTIHDAWLVNESDIEKTETIINNCFINKYNNKPSLSIEKIK